MVSCTLDPLYYILAKTAITNKAIAIAMLEFVAKVTDNKKELLWYHAINQIDDLEPLQSLYLKKYNLNSIASVVKFLKQACAMDEPFNNLPPTRQVQKMYAILDKKKTCLHAMIQAMLKRIDNILQKRKSLQA